MRLLTRTWITGGMGLIVCGIIGILRNSLLGAPGIEYLSVTADLIYAAAVLLLGIGLSREASVVGRKPLGVAAIAVLAVWPLLTDLATWLLAFLDPEGQSTAWSAVGYISLIVPVGAGLIAAIQIARAGVIQPPWRWAPLWVLGIHALAWTIPQLIFTSVGPGEAQLYANFFALLSTVAFLASTLGLGILALVLAARRRPTSVEVFRSA